MWWEEMSYVIWLRGDFDSWWASESGNVIWNVSDYEMIWIYSWTWIGSRTVIGCVSVKIATVTWRTWKSESWTVRRTFLCYENDSWTDYLHARCYASLVPFSFWLSSWL